jgi:hypothetical protein
LTGVRLIFNVARMNRLLSGVLGLSVVMLAQASEQVPDFRLTDANQQSNRHGGQVSPRDYLLQVSGFYFGSAG